MIKRLFYWMPILIIFLSTGIACEGPEGPQGPQGEQGPEGPVGPASEDGSMIHAGDGPPDADIGNLNDYYLDQSAAELYGPKAQDGWGTPVSLQGPPGEDGQDGADGQDGEDGSQILSGTTEPDASTGSPGDYYLNKSTFDLYGPKTESGWGTPINLQATTNVMYSVWMDIEWGDSSNEFNKVMSIPEPRITEDFLSSGTVLMYFKQEGSGNIAVSLLPVFLSENEYVRSIAMITSSPEDFAGIALIHESLDQVTPISIDLTEPGFQVRYVLIPGSEEIIGKASGKQLPINPDNYKEVKKYYGIRESE